MENIKYSGTNLDTVLIKNGCTDYIKSIPSTYRYLAFFNVYKSILTLFHST